MSKKVHLCCICGKPFRPGEWGNNPEPVKPYSSGTCCDECNMDKVVPARLAALPKRQEADRIYRPGAKDKEPL